MDDDDDYSEGSFGGSIQNDSCAGSSMSASVKNAAASKRASRYSNITVHEDSSGTEVVETNAQKTKRAPRCLREYSAIVADTLKTKGRTTYAEVADDIISKLCGNESETATSLSESEEKNIRRRVYDAINVLEAMKIIRKHKKEIKWEGLPDRSTVDLEGMKAECGTLMNTIRRKTAYLKDLQEQVENLQTLMMRNDQLLKSGNTRPERFSLPFILAQTSRDATVEVEISEDMRMVYFDFNSSPFFLHDDTYIIKLLLGRQQPERTNVS